MTSYQTLIRDVQGHPVTAVVSPDQGQSTIFPVLWLEKNPSERIIVIRDSPLLFSDLFNSYSKKYKTKFRSSTELIDRKANIVYLSPGAIYQRFLTRRTKILRKFKLIFIHGIGSGNIILDLIFPMMYHLRHSFNGRVVLSGLSIGYPLKDIYFHQPPNIDWENLTNPFISYYNRSFRPQGRTDRKMLQELHQLVLDKLTFNIIDNQAVGNVVVILPGNSEIDQLKKMFARDDLSDHRIITLSGRNKNPEIIRNLYSPRGNIILTTNIIHSIQGIENIRVVFDSMQEKRPVTLRNGSTMIQTQQISVQEANNRAFLAYPRRPQDQGYVFRLTTKDSMKLFEKIKASNFPKQAIYEIILQTKEHQVDEKVLLMIMAEETVFSAIEDLEKYLYLSPGGEVSRSYTHTFGLVEERIFADYLAQPAPSRTEQISQSKKFCFIVFCALVSNYHRGYFDYSGVRLKDAKGFYLDNFQRYEGDNQLLTYFRLVLDLIPLLRYPQLRQKIEVFSEERKLISHEVYRLMKTIQEVAQSQGAEFTPGLLEERDYVELSNIFVARYSQYLPGSVLTRKGNHYLVGEGRFEYRYRIDELKLASNPSKLYLSEKVVAFSLVRRSRGNDDGYLSFYAPLVTDQSIKVSYTIVPVPNPLNSILGEWASLERQVSDLPHQIREDKIVLDRFYNQQFASEEIYPRSFENDEDLFDLLLGPPDGEIKPYEPQIKMTDLLSFKETFPQFSSEEYELPSNIRSTFYDSIQGEYVHFTILSVKQDRAQFDLLQPTLLKEPVRPNQLAPEQKWEEEVKVFNSEDERLTIFDEIVKDLPDGRVTYDQDQLEEWLKPFRKYSLLSSLDGLLQSLLEGQEPRVFENDPHFGGLMTLALLRQFSYITPEPPLDQQELMDLTWAESIVKATSSYQLISEDWKVLFEAQPNLQLESVPSERVNLALFRYTFYTDPTEFIKTLQEVLFRVEQWVVLWIEDSRSYRKINQMVSDQPGLSYYGVFRANPEDPQYYWIYGIIQGKDEEKFEFE